LNGNVSTSDIDTAYNFVADELKLIEKFENPEIEFSPNVTVIYGANGSG